VVECAVDNSRPVETGHDGNYFERSQALVVMEIGPVLALEDVAGGKVCALASRVEAGHAPHQETPVQFADLLEQFIAELDE
jgi:hypothetical protein